MVWICCATMSAWAGPWSAEAALKGTREKIWTTSDTVQRFSHEAGAAEAEANAARARVSEVYPY
jgi:hypothetical protein